MRLLLFLFLCTLWTPLVAQTNDNPCPDTKVCPPYEVQLKNNFRLLIGDTTGRRRTIRLTGDGLNTTLQSVDLRTSNEALGWLARDFDDYFMLYSKNPENATSGRNLQVYVYQKQTGKLWLSGPFIAFDDTGLTLLFIDVAKEEHLGLLDFSTMKTDYFLPPDTACTPWWTCINDHHVSTKDVTIDFRVSENYSKRRVYIR